MKQQRNVYKFSMILTPKKDALRRECSLINWKVDADYLLQYSVNVGEMEMCI